MMNRRIFIKNIGASALFLSLGGLHLSAKKSGKHITILHTNDTHSHIDPLPANNPKNPNQGGVARRATIIEQIRKENPNTLLFDAGDIFQGTPYFNFYGGELEFKLMSMMKYDAATLGNHDFDNGIDGLYKQLPHAKFDFLIANYDFSNTIMNGKTKSYKIYTLQGLRIGVFGLGIELKNLVDQKMYKETIYLNPLDIAQDMERKLKNEEKCDLIICLSHLGYQYQNKNKISDMIIAQNTSNIDLIIGGHTHTFLTQPTMVTNQNNKTTLINQVGCFGINLGRIDFYFEKGMNIQNNSKNINVL